MHAFDGLITERLAPATDLMKSGVANVFEALDLRMLPVEFAFANGESLNVNVELGVEIDDGRIGYVRYSIVEPMKVSAL